jgi:transposase-like protein
MFLVNRDAFNIFCQQFEQEDDCIRILFELKWTDGFRCPHCSHPHAYHINTRRLPLYQCRSCHAQTSLIVGTIMEGSRTPLHLWFQAIFLHSQPYSINARDLSILINVTYKTAWLICHKIRHAMACKEAKELLTGIVRVTDAVYCRRYTGLFEFHKHEQPLLIGSSENEQGEIGRIKIKQQSKKPMIDKYDCPNVKPFIQQYIDPEAASQAIVTRRFGKGMNKPLIQYSLNTTYWLALQFRGIGPKHLQVYLDHFCYLENHHEQSMFIDLLQDSAITPTLTYPQLTGSSKASRSLNRSRSFIRHSSQVVS